MYSNNTTGFRGIRSTPCGRWYGQIKQNGKMLHLGSYATKQEAARAYDEAAVRLHGEFATLNFPKGCEL
jgi:hypothetical protein